MVKAFRISRATAQRDIDLLKKKGLVEFNGVPRRGRYLLTRNTAGKLRKE